MALATVVLQLIIALSFAGEVIPLPPWYIYGGGIGSTWGGSSPDPDYVQLTVSMSPPAVPNQYVTAVATGSADLLQMTPATTYTFTLAASVSGSAACEALTVDGSEVIAHTLIFGPTWKRYTNSFTLGGPEDARVGRYLNVQLLLMKSGFNYGSATATFTNLQVQAVTERPKLLLQSAGDGMIELLWPTNFHWYQPEQSTNLETDAWEMITNQSILMGTNLVVGLAPPARACFFRLRQP